MSNYALIISAIFLAFAVAELAAGRFFQERARASDWIVDLVSSAVVPGVIAPAILLTVHAGLAYLWPRSTDALADLPWWTMAGLFLLFDDLPQYWWHRLSHTVPALYALHRVHHEARYMSVRLVYRNNLLYYATLPGGWLSAILVHLGGGPI